MPGNKGFRVFAGPGGAALRIEHRADAPLFIASAYKTFILAQFLRDVEAGRLDEDRAVAIDDAVRTLGSPVFLDLAGSTPARSVLEAMMAHSDNLATDAATAAGGIERVRALLAQAGLGGVLIPDSTRRLASYIFGAPYGVDIGWAGIEAATRGHLPGTPRPALNGRETITASPRDLVAWYEQALGGALFGRRETLIEFKRIHATSVQIPDILPPGSVAYVKGGEVDNLFGFFAKSMAGQVIVETGIETGGARRLPITFCFLVNWDNPDGTGFAEVQARFFAAVRDILREVKRLVR